MISALQNFLYSVMTAHTSHLRSAIILYQTSLNHLFHQSCNIKPHKNTWTSFLVQEFILSSHFVQEKDELIAEWEPEPLVPEVEDDTPHGFKNEFTG